MARLPYGTAARIDYSNAVLHVCGSTPTTHVRRRVCVCVCVCYGGSKSRPIVVLLDTQPVCNFAADSPSPRMCLNCLLIMVKGKVCHTRILLLEFRRGAHLPS